MKKVLKGICYIVTSLVVLFILVGMCASESKDKTTVVSATSSEPTANSATQEKTPPFSEFIRAENIADEFKKNEFTANKKYKGSVVFLFGESSKVQLDLFDNPMISLDSEEFGLGGVQVSLNPKDQYLDKISKGDIVYVRCIGKGEVIGTAMMDKCVVLKVD